MAVAGATQQPPVLSQDRFGLEVNLKTLEYNPNLYWNRQANWAVLYPVKLGAGLGTPQRKEISSAYPESCASQGTIWICSCNFAGTNPMLVVLGLVVRIWPSSPRPVPHPSWAQSSFQIALLYPIQHLFCPATLSSPLFWPAQAGPNLPASGAGPPVNMLYGMFMKVGSWHKGLVLSWGEEQVALHY